MRTLGPFAPWRGVPFSSADLQVGMPGLYQKQSSALPPPFVLMD